jgi:hypothetical protein
VGEIEKLHSLVLSKSAACLSFITERASCTVWAGVSGCGLTLVILPSTLIAGGKSAVMNRSEPLRASISFNKSVTNFDAWSTSIKGFLVRKRLWDWGSGFGWCARRSKAGQA